mgnify:CR=1 FL=1
MNLEEIAKKMVAKGKTINRKYCHLWRYTLLAIGFTISPFRTMRTRNEKNFTNYT